MEQVAFSLFPALIDLVIAVIYVGHLFGLRKSAAPARNATADELPDVSFVILLSGVAYMYLNLVSVSWGATRQRRLNKLYRESSAANSEAVSQLGPCKVHNTCISLRDADKIADNIALCR